MSYPYNLYQVLSKIGKRLFLGSSGLTTYYFKTIVCLKALKDYGIGILEINAASESRQARPSRKAKRHCPDGTIAEKV